MAKCMKCGVELVSIPTPDDATGEWGMCYNVNCGRYQKTQRMDLMAPGEPLKISTDNLAEDSDDENSISSSRRRAGK